MPKKNNQRNKILRYLETHDGATVRDLTIDLEINSVTKRVSELVAMGFPIEKEDVHVVNKRGEHKKFVRYSLRKGEA